MTYIEVYNTLYKKATIDDIVAAAMAQKEPAQAALDKTLDGAKTVGDWVTELFNTIKKKSENGKKFLPHKWQDGIDLIKDTMSNQASKLDQLTE